jgi:hypothetical protein
LKRTALAALAALVLTCPSFAHDFWINNRGYKGPDGVHCCGENDCFELPKDAVRMTGRGYVIAPRLALGPENLTKLGPESEFVPFHEAPPSEDGKYWRCQKPTGERRCVFAPHGGS